MSKKENIKITDEMVFGAWQKMLIFMSMATKISLEVLCSKPLEKILDEIDYSLSRYVSRLFVAHQLGIVSDEEVILTLSGKSKENQRWFPSDEFQEEYEKHWNNVCVSAESFGKWFNK